MPAIPFAAPSRAGLAALLLGLVGLLGLMGFLMGPAAGADAEPYVPAGPTLDLPADATFVVGRPGAEYLIQADGEPVSAIGVDRLPTGLRLIAHGDGTATIAGTPAGPAGVTTVEVRAQNASGSTSAALTVAVQQAPAFVDRGPIVFEAGEPGSALVRAVGFPRPGIAVDGDLPAGLTFVDNRDGTATITGTPVGGAGSSPVTLTAVNVVSDATRTTTIRVVVVRAASGAGAGPAHSGPRREP